ncbi:MAG TPA: endonuclease/exonuclease/phosphatase family protein [Polyangiaceae bacterium]
MIRRLGRMGVCVVLVSTACTACGAENGDGNEPEPFRLQAMTYNAGLAPNFEPFADERAPLVITELASRAQDLDLLCVQEFWRQEDAESLATASMQALPHTLRAEPSPGSGDCSVDELGPVGECLATQCGTFEGVERTACAEAACGAEVTALSGGCLGCILNSLDGSLESCVGDGSAPEDPAIFGGAYDTMLLSRHPFDETEVKTLDGYLVRTAVLYAKVTLAGLGPVHAFCTHLGSPLGVIPYAGPHGSWEGEHAAQVAALSSFIETKANDSLPVIVLGDLNMGPAAGSSVAVLGDQYDALVAARLDNPYASGRNALCTDCADNAFHATAPDYPDSIIDHVLIRDFPDHYWTAQRVLDEPVDLGEVSMNLSDHYGVRLVLQSELPSDLPP